MTPNGPSDGGAEPSIGSIADLVNDRDIITANPLLTVREAARLMAEKRIGAVVVLDDAEVAGIFTERDLLIRVVGADRDPDTTTLAEVMTANPQTVDPDDSIQDVVSWMLSGRRRHLPVVHDGHLIGIVSQGDVMAYLRTRGFPA
jgi:CBS domain-containing protein